jgi:hypothetical protein
VPDFVTAASQDRALFVAFASKYFFVVLTFLCLSACVLARANFVAGTRKKAALFHANSIVLLFVTLALFHPPACVWTSTHRVASLGEDGTLLEALLIVLFLIRSAIAVRALWQATGACIDTFCALSQAPSLAACITTAFE